MVSASAPLGFSLNPFRYVKQAASGVYHVASDTRVQRAAAAAAQAYAPNQYAAASTYADRARGIISPGQMPPPMPMAPPGAVVDDAGSDGGPVVEHPNIIQKNKFMPFIIIGGGALVLLMLLKK